MQDDLNLWNYRTLSLGEGTRKHGLNSDQAEHFWLNFCFHVWHQQDEWKWMKESDLNFIFPSHLFPSILTSALFMFQLFWLIWSPGHSTTITEPREIELVETFRQTFKYLKYLKTFQDNSARFASNCVIVTKNTNVFYLYFQTQHKPQLQLSSAKLALLSQLR